MSNKIHSAVQPAQRTVHSYQATYPWTHLVIYVACFGTRRTCMLNGLHDHTRCLHFWTNAKSAWKVTNQWVNSLLNQRMQLTEQRESGLGFCKLGSMTKLQMTQTRGCSSAVSALPWYSMKAATMGSILDHHDWATLYFSCSESKPV